LTWREITCNDTAQLERALFVDVRSPCEHEEASIPGSVNVPLLSNEERSIVGTIYKVEGERVARQQALRLISRRVPELLDEILALQNKRGQPLIIYCWRGGLRSEAVASLLNIAGINCFRLTGGFKAWRQVVIKDLNCKEHKFKPVILHGLTGVGKTDILHALFKLGMEVLDLELIANHRGSVFGGLGKNAQPSQKQFEGLLWKQLSEMKAGHLFIEAESRRIGKLTLPDLVYREMIFSGSNILVTGTLAQRVARISADYLGENIDPALALKSMVLMEPLKEKMGAKKLNELKDLVQQEKIEEAIRVALTDYYDPLYQKHLSRLSPFALEVSGDDPEAAAEQLLKFAKDLTGRAQVRWEFRTT
jgi:tRNA 2-selenouridine synthase